MDGLDTFVSPQTRRFDMLAIDTLSLEYRRAVYNESIRTSRFNLRLATEPRHFLACAYAETEGALGWALDNIGGTEDVVKSLLRNARYDEEVALTADEVVEIFEVEGLAFAKVVAPYPDYVIVTFSNLEDWGKFIDSKAAQDFAVWWSRTEDLMEVWVF
jgi:hypothetical protein